jgi:hypothetical protein
MCGADGDVARLQIYHSRLGAAFKLTESVLAHGIA